MNSSGSQRRGRLEVGSRRAGLAFALMLSSCGEGAGSEVTYEADIRPLFEERCAVCHHAAAGGIVNIQDPYAPETGLLNAVNPWRDSHPEGNTPELSVVAGDPVNSFLLWKLGDPESPVLDPPVAGDSMPLQLPLLTPDEIGTLESWVTAGALDDDVYRARVRPIFGDPGLTALGRAGRGRCVHCHYSGSPVPGDLTDPFGPEGVVNVPSRFRADLNRVAPGDVEASFLILKVRATVPSALIGAPMPYRDAPLSSAQIAAVRRWIVEGARP
jgi:hypothetical protein